MQPFTLRTRRLLLDQPVEADVDRIAEYCADPVFERFMVTPWPYERRHAVFFVEEFVPGGWSRGDEWTWALREQPGAPLLGAAGIRLDSGMVGYWLGAPHRGRGLMAEAVAAVVAAAFERTDRDLVRWECVVGNSASVQVARKAGFRFTGPQHGLIATRSGAPADSLTGVLRRGDDVSPQPGWPADGAALTTP